VIVLCGINDNNQVRPDAEVERWLGRSRLLAFLRRATRPPDDPVLATGSSTDKRVAPGGIVQVRPGEQQIRVVDREDETRPFSMRFGSPTDATAQGWIVEDLTRVAAKARAAGAVPIFCTYFADAGWMDRANVAIVAAAEATGARLVDTRPAMSAAIERRGHSQLLFPDHHLRADGYAVLARVLFNALIEEGVIAAEPVDPLEKLGQVRDDSIRLAPWMRGGELFGVEVEFAPNERVQLILSESTGLTPVYWDGSTVIGKGIHWTEIPLARDARMALSLKRVKRYSGKLDDAGRARIALHPDDLASAVLFGCVLTVSDSGKIEVASDAIQLR
jgi:hypothetical protein